MNLPDKIKIDAKVQSPELSVIIPFHGNPADLSNCLEGLKNQNINMEFEIIVVESGNEPEVKNLVNDLHNARLISSPSLMYPGRARNTGVRYSKADLLAFIDADCMPLPDWLTMVYSSLKKGNDIATGPIINLYPFHPVASVDNLFLFSDFQKHRTLKNFEHFAGCNFGITRSLYQKVGGFQEDMIIAEDTKFSESALQKGKIVFNQKMIVKHCGRKELARFKKHHESFGFYKGYLNLKKSPVYSKLRKNYFYPVLLGFRRMIYISIRTLQWNPAGLLRIIFYFPVFILGLSAWINGFRKGQSRYLAEISSLNSISLENKIEKFE